MAAYRKWLVTLATFLGGLITAGLVEGTARTVVLVLLLALTSAGVVAVPNKAKP